MSDMTDVYKDLGILGIEGMQAVGIQADGGR